MREVRKLAVLLALSVLVTGVTAALPGCGSSAATEQNAAPVSTAPLLQEEVPTTPFPSNPSPTPSPVPAEQDATPASTALRPESAGVPPRNTADSSPAPSPPPAADDALEFVQTDSLVSAGRDEGITGVEKETSKKEGSPADPVQGQTYTWEDGDRTFTVYLQTDLVVEKGSDGLPRDIVSADEVGAVAARGEVGQSANDTLPVFRSESGSLMTLHGGVFLVLDPEWTEEETKAFLSSNGIKMERVSELGYVANGFLIETDPGFPSLDLANELAALDGVEVASPNWGREAVPK